MKKAVVFIILALLVVSGCGYTTKTLLGDHLKSIYIAPFDSKIDITKESEYRDHYRIYRPGLEREFREIVKDRFVFDGTLKVVNTEDEADSILVCNIIDFRKEPLQYTDSKTVDEYRLKIIVDMKFTDLVENRVLVNEKELSGEATYTLSGAFAGSESSAQTTAVTDLARRMVERVVENW